jgi:thiamine biosynthesis lipoprotein
MTVAAARPPGRVRRATWRWALAGLLAGASALPPVSFAHADTAAPTERKLVYADTAMGTVVQVTLWTDDEPAAARGAEAVFDEFRRLDAMMTTWTDTSEVSRVNAAAGRRAVAVSEETFTVIQRAVEVARRSKGVFDITVGAFQGLWKFDQDRDGTIPADDEIEARRALVGWKHVQLDARRRTVKLRKKGMRITLGGIAKGFAVDRAARLLWDAGFVDFIVQAGGDMYVSGAKGGAPWVVGIRDPRGEPSDSFAAAPIRDHSFSTSGDYERGFVRDGVRYHHILDPRTARPARASRSVTVMARDAFTADAWSKVLFILGAERAMPLVEELEDLEAVFVTDDNRVVISSGLQGVVKQLHPPGDGP